MVIKILWEDKDIINNEKEMANPFHDYRIHDKTLNLICKKRDKRRFFFLIQAKSKVKMPH